MRNAEFGLRSAPAYARRLRRAGLPAPPSAGTGAGRQGMRNGIRKEDAPL